jgi:hypothetical protein
MKKVKLTNTANQGQLQSVTRWAQAGLALGLAYVLTSWAIDSGSLLQYAVAVVFAALGVRHIVQAVHCTRSGQ